jgi:hypothetical protein
MAESLKRLVNIGTFTVLQDKLERWLDNYHVSEENIVSTYLFAHAVASCYLGKSCYRHCLIQNQRRTQSRWLSTGFMHGLDQIAYQI